MTNMTLCGCYVLVTVGRHSDVLESDVTIAGVSKFWYKNYKHICLKISANLIQQSKDA